MLLPNEWRKERPLRKSGETGCVDVVPKKLCPKAKDSSVLRHIEKTRRELLEPGPSALISTALLKDINLPYEACSGQRRFHAQQIISSIKSFRNKN